MTTKSGYGAIVCRTEEFQLGQRKLVKLEREEIVVMNVNHNLYAFRGKCPHQGAPLIHGSVTGVMLPSEPHEYKYGRDDELIKCPLHGWSFDLKTGKSLFSSKVKVKTFDVYEEGGFIILYLKEKPTHMNVENFGCPDY